METLSASFLRNYPTLGRLIQAGVIKVEDMSYLGLASDGVWVDIGSVHDPRGADSYLLSHPTPSDW